MRWRSASLTACSCALMLAGCGGASGRTESPPKLPAELGERLVTASDGVAQSLARGDPCGAVAEARRLEATAIAAVNGRRVPQGLAEPLLSGAHELVAAIRCVQPPPPPPADTEDCGDGKGHEGHGEGRRRPHEGRKQGCEGD